MSRLIYKSVSSDLFKSGSCYLLHRIIDDGDEIEIVIDGAESGAVIIDERAFMIQKGTARLKKGSLSDGAFAPYAIIGSRRIALSPFTVSEGNVYAYVFNEYAERLSELIASLYSRILQLEDGYLALKKAIEGENLFNFE